MIVYAAGTSELHQIHIVLHEVGHMIAGHLGDCAHSTETARRLLPHVRPALIDHIMGRTIYASGAEWEAEMIAGYIWSTSARRWRRESGQAGPGLVPQLAWIEQSCGR